MAISDTARPASSEVEAISCEADDSVCEDSETAPTISRSPSREVL